MARYKIQLTFARLEVEADLAAAHGEAPIFLVVGDDEDELRLKATGLKTADCGHDPRRMAAAVVKSMGSEWWHNPDDPLDMSDKAAVTAYIEGLIVHVS